jgi:hypothetical protein
VSYFVTYFVICQNHMVQEGPFAGKSLALLAGSFAGESVAKHDILLQYAFITTCSDLWPYTKGSVRMEKGGFSSRLASNEITTRGYRALPLQSVQLS